MQKNFRRFMQQAFPLILADIVVVFFSYFIALALRFDGRIPNKYFTSFVSSIPLIILFYCLINYATGLYRWLWRYASAQEIILIFGATGTTTLLLEAANLLWGFEQPLPVSVIIMGGIFASGGFTAVRYRKRLLTGLMGRLETVVGSPDRRLVLIVGAGEAGQLLAWQLKNRDIRHKYEVVGFVDDDPQKLGMRVHGAKVLGTRRQIPALVAQRAVDLIIVAIHKVSGEDFRDILSLCHQTSAQVKVLPDLPDVIEGNGQSLRLKDPAVEDLLGREPVRIDLGSCREVLSGKVVLVTGAAGSIGSELCRQILRFDPGFLLMLDNNETALHNLEMELPLLADTWAVECILGDILRREKLETVFRTYHPQVIFHSAACKHVPMMEKHPDEAVWVNIQGTRILSELAWQYGVERFVFISTDKAVNPCSVMGITKQIGEMLVTGLPPKDGSLFTAVRFGNVLGSRGSVVPTFKKQIDRGGPVTITHPEAKRFFMTVQEAASLVIQAASLTEGGDIFMLEMGEEIGIEDLARKMIRLDGLQVGKDIQIEYIGLRPGEKLEEELVNPGEEKEPTAHPRISRVVNSSHQVNRARLLEQVDELIELALAQRNREIAVRLRGMMPYPALRSVKEIGQVVSDQKMGPSHITPAARGRPRKEN